MAGPSAAVLAGRQRRAGAAGQSTVRFEWFIKNVGNRIAMTMVQRVRLATEHLKSRVVQNISRPVTKSEGVRSGRVVVSDRSKPGEFPKADTTRLRKDIFGDVRKTSRGITDGMVGTTLDYGLILETKMDRSFLVKTLNQERGNIVRMLTGPIKK